MTAHEKLCALVAQANAQMWADVARADIEAGWIPEALYAQRTAQFWHESALSYLTAE